MRIDPPAAVLRAMEILRDGGYAAYLVGGCVRDACRGAVPHDWDIAASSRPEETAAAFAGYRVLETGIRHGTVTVLLDGEALEITTFRQDGAYSDHRHPESVAFVRALREDLRRRDFTVNAMAWSPWEGLVDPFGGRQDLAARTLRAVGDPARRFDEDALRILRGLRFSSVLGFSVAPATRAAMTEKSALLAWVSGERVLQELKKLLLGAHVLSMLLTCPDVLRAVLPEIGPAVGFDQHSRYHIYDVWEHTARAVAAAPMDLTVRLALLFHDLGKPACAIVDAAGEGHFYGHGVESAHMADAALRRLKSDRRTREAVVWLVAMHDQTLPGGRAGARRLLSRYGIARTRQLLQMRIADHAAHNPAYPERGDEGRRLLALVEDEWAARPCLTLGELAVRGKDLTALGYSGPAVGEALRFLLEAVLSGVCPNERQALLAHLRAGRGGTGSIQT